MQKLFKRGISKKVILVIIIAILFNFIVPNHSHAMDPGVLLDPIKCFIAFVGDTAITEINLCFSGQWIGAVDSKAEGADSNWKEHWAESFGDEIDWPVILITPEEIFSGKVAALEVNFLKEYSSNNVTDLKNNNGEDMDEATRASIYNGDKSVGTQNYINNLNDLRKQIAKWYLLIRNLSATALFCVLIYIGIRILISSVSEERAKYKAMMINWITAICIVFFLHYIMAVIMYITEKAVDVLDGGLAAQQYVIYRPESNNTPEPFKMKKFAKIGGGQSDANGQVAQVHNLMEMIRVYVSLENRGMAFGYLIVYLVLVVYTIIFIIKYLKRFIYMAFLTMIAPLIAFTYPIDKIKDGTAQAFNKWLVEYLFNALLQPLHLLIYVVLVGSAGALVQVNFIYAIVALAFINKAEKLMKEMFGFNKAGTPPSPGGSVLAANLLQSGYNRLRSGSGKSGSASTKSGGNSGGSSSSRIRQSRGLDVYSSSNSEKTNNKKEEKNADGKREKTSDRRSSRQISEESAQQMREGANAPQMPEGSSAQMSEEASQRQIPGGTSSQSNKSFESERKADSPSKVISQKNNEKRKIKKPNGRIKSLLKAGGKAIGRNSLRAAKYTGKKLGRGAIRTAAFAATAIPTMAAGVVAYGATGEAKYLGMGLGAAYALSGRATDKISKAPNAIRTAYRNEKLGTEEAAKQTHYDEFMKNEDNYKYFKDKYGWSKKETKKNLKDRGEDYIKAGYSNAEDIDRLMSMQESIPDATSDQVIAADQMASKFKYDDLMDMDKSVKIEENLAKQIRETARKNGHTMTSRESEKAANRHMNLMRSSQGISHVSLDRVDEYKSEKAKERKTSASNTARKRESREQQIQQETLDVPKQLTSRPSNARTTRRNSSTARKNSTSRGERRTGGRRRRME